MARDKIPIKSFFNQTTFFAAVILLPLLASTFNSCDNMKSKKNQEVLVDQSVPVAPTPSPSPNPSPSPTPNPTPNPGGLMNQWQGIAQTSTPQARAFHSAIWTGTRMLIWGGVDSTNLAKNDGASYDPVTGIWTTISVVGAPTARFSHSAVWNGTQMLVWGGFNGSAYLNDGATYDPATNTWSPIVQTSTVAPRAGHTAVFQGQAMLMWGGSSTTIPGGFSDGGYYTLNIGWSTLTSTAAVLSRAGHSAVWTGSRMLLFGGLNGGVASQDGFSFDPMTFIFSYFPIGAVNTPSPRSFHSAVWTGNRMIIWGGQLPGVTTNYFENGAIYDPVTGSWIAASVTNAPTRRSGHSAVWTGQKMLLWGGVGETNPPTYLNSGAQFN
jgi:hypothetical protein